VTAPVDRARSQLRDRRTAQITTIPWRPPIVLDFASGRMVLAFDATLTHCGWVLFEVRGERIVVIERGTINLETGQRSYLETWDKARQLWPALSALIVGRGWQAEVVVEAPLAASLGNRTESSLIAGMLVWLHDPDRTAVVSATHVAAVLLGEHRIRSADRKKAIRAAVNRLLPEAAGRTWNEHQRDALATGLTHLFTPAAASR
jgi:Holliday junction resolvasome RuvABC endonuclease subunit